MAKSVTRPDTPLAATPEPVTIGRLKEVRDSLVNKAKEKAQNGLLVASIGNKESAKEYFKQGILDATAAKKYSTIIDKNQK